MSDDLNHSDPTPIDLETDPTPIESAPDATPDPTPIESGERSDPRIEITGETTPEADPGAAPAAPEVSDFQNPGGDVPPEVEPEPDAPEEQIAFDINDFPGGARSAIEAVVMVVDQPVTAEELAAALEMALEDVEGHLASLEAEYDEQERGFTLRVINGAWRVYSRSDYAPVIEKFLLDGQQAKLTQASLETLAVIAYRQPISRSRVSAVRGVNVDGVIRTLLTRGLIHEIGQDTEGGAMLYGTTPFFLQRLGLGSLEELPPLAPHLPEADMIDELVEQGHG